MNCSEFRKFSDENIMQALDGYKLDANEAIDNITGSDLSVRNRFESGDINEKRIYNTYKKVREKLMDILIKNGEYSSFIKSPEEFTVGLKEYVLRTSGLPTEFISRVKDVNSHTYLNILRRLNKVVDAYINGKPENAFMRASMPAILYTASKDSLGMMSRVVKHATEITELVKSRHEKPMNDIKFVEHGFRNLLQQVVDIPSPKFVPEPIHDIPTNNEEYPMVSYLGTIEKDGNTYHRVIGYKGDEEKMLLMQETDILKEDILNGLYNYYAYELANDLAAGQTRLYQFKDAVPKEHREFIFRILDYVHNNEDVHLKDMRNVTTTVIGDREYYSIAIKAKPDMEFTDKEWYNVYLLGERNLTTDEFIGYRSDKQSKPEMSDLNNKARLSNINFFKDGYYKAQTFSNVVTVREEFQDDRDFTNFTYMETQPSPNLLSDTVETGRKDINYNNLWEVIREKRRIWARADEDIKRASRDEQEEYKKLFLNKNNDFNRNLKKIYGVDFDDLTQTLRLMFHLGSRLYIDSEKDMVATPNSYYISRNENYSPILFEDDVVIEDLVRAIDELQDRKSQVNLDDEQIKVIDEQIQNFAAVLYAKTGEHIFFKKEEAPLVVAERNVYTKQRKKYTSVMRRRKDSQVDHDYLDKLYYSMEKTHLITNLLIAMNEISQRFADEPGIAKAQISYAFNSVRKALGDATAPARFGNIDFSYTKLQGIINGLTGKEISPDGAKKITDMVKSFMSMVYLGMDGAMVNNTQFVNFTINFSNRLQREAKAVMDGKRGRDEKIKWDAIVDATGVDNVVTGFTDALAPGGDIGAADLGLLDTKLGLHVPMPALFDFVRLVSMRKETAINDNPIKEVDRFLKDIEEIRLESLNKDLQKIKSIENQLKDELPKAKRKSLEKIIATTERRLKTVKDIRQKRTLVQLRKNFINLLLLPKDADPALAERMYRNIIGKAADDLMKRMVSAKLGWWPEGLGVISKMDDLFTYLEGERNMRRQGVIAALMFVDELGILNGEDTSVTVEVDGEERTVIINSKFMTDMAKSIARTYTSMTMYGMTAVNLGEAMSGFGDSVFQYKGYTIQQGIHDHYLWTSMMNGNYYGKYNPVEIMSRLSAAAGKSMYSWGTGKKYNPKDKSIDHDAVKVLRFLMTRGTASIVATFIELFRPILKSFKMFGADSVMGLFYGAQSPQMGLFFRFFIRSLLVASMYSDDDDKLLDQAFRGTLGVAMLFLPVWITAAIAATYNTATSFK